MATVDEPKSVDDEVIDAAMLRLKDASLIDVLLGQVLAYERIQEVLVARDPSSRRWKSKKAAKNRIETLARNHQSDAAVKLPPQEWLATEVAKRMDSLDLALRTSPSASVPLRELIAGLEERPPNAGDWPLGLAAAAEQTFLQAFTEADERRGGLTRDQMLPYRFLAFGALDREGRSALMNYQRHWKRLLELSGREMRPGRTVPLLLRQIAALEDGFVGMAARNERAKRGRFARDFGRAVEDLVEAATRQRSLSG